MRLGFDEHHNGQAPAALLMRTGEKWHHDSPHYADQAPLFVAHDTRPVSSNPAALRGNPERSYRP